MFDQTFRPKTKHIMYTVLYVNVYYVCMNDVCVVKLMVITIQRNKRPENESEKSSSSDTGEPESWRLRRRRFR